MKKIFLLSFLLFSFAKANEAIRCDLNFKKLSACAEIDWVYGPYLDQYTSFNVKYSENAAITSIKVIPWMVMKDHEHGSRPVNMTKIGERDFLVDKAYFMGGMMGTWYIKVQLFNAQNQMIDEDKLPVTFK